MLKLDLKATRIGRLIHEFGMWTSGLYLLDRLGSRWFTPLRARSYRIVAQPVQPAPRLPQSRAKRFTWREIAPGDPALAALPVSRLTRAFRFDQGAHCLGLFRGDELAGYVWLRLGDYREDEVRVRFVPEPPGTVAWDFDAYVFPAYRMGTAFAALWDAANAFLRARGIRHSLSRIAATNLASLRSHAKLGTVELGGLSVLSLWRLQLCLSDLPEGPRVSLSISRRPTFVCRVPAAPPVEPGQG